jgi:hypothetical protein
MMDSVRPVSLSIWRSSSMNGHCRRRASNEPRVDFPAPRKPVSAMRERRKAEGAPLNFSRSNLCA